MLYITALSSAKATNICNPNPNPTNYAQMKNKKQKMVKNNKIKQKNTVVLLYCTKMLLSGHIFIHLKARPELSSEISDFLSKHKHLRSYGQNKAI